MKHKDYWQLTAFLRHANEKAEQMMQPYCGEKGLTPLQLRVLLALHFEGPSTASLLARSTGMADANCSALCKKLAQGGLIYRRRDEADERQVLISLAPEGTALAEGYLASCEKDLRAIRKCVPPEDMLKIETGLECLSRILEIRSQP